MWCVDGCGTDYLPSDPDCRGGVAELVRLLLRDGLLQHVCDMFLWLHHNHELGGSWVEVGGGGGQ